MNEKTSLWNRFLNRRRARLRATHVTTQRLASDVEAFEARLEARLERARGQDWAKAVRRHLAAAHKAIAERQISAGYESLLAAERDALPGLSPEERRARLKSLREEADRKLAGSWRGRASKALLGDPRAPVSIAAMQEAMFHVHSKSQNNYHKLDLLRQQLRILAAILGLLVLGSIVLARFGAFDGIATSASELLPIAIFFGLLGGALSAMISVKQTPMKLEIPDSQRSAVIALVRVMIGGAAAIPIYVLIEGDLITLSLGGNSGDVVPELMAFCFLGGFSERWFLGRIGALSGDKPTEEAAGAGERGAASGEDHDGSPTTPLTYRAGVGVVLCRGDGKVLLGQRLDAAGRTWQFPQGGIENDETALEAARRELHEELGLDATSLEFVAEAPALVSYRLPEDYRSARVGQGQTQNWFLFRLKEDVVFEVAPVSEFKKVQWVPLAEVVELADEFRRGAYQRVVDAFAEKLKGLNGKPAGTARKRTRTRTSRTTGS